MDGVPGRIDGVMLVEGQKIVIDHLNALDFEHVIGRPLALLLAQAPRAQRGIYMVRIDRINNAPAS